MSDTSDAAAWSPDTLRDISRRILEALGTPADIAESVARDVVDANLAGHDSHGVIRIPQYARAIEAGDIIPDARAEVLSDRGGTLLISGGWGFGLAAGRAAMALAIARAKDLGVAAAALVRAHHLGRLGIYPEQAGAAGCVGMAWVGGIGSGELLAVPYGGARAAFGTNPIAAGFPMGEDPPFLLDFATTSVARGKVMVARDAGTPLPPGSIVDRDGLPSTDPADFFAGGALLPFGGHKGYALAVLAELLGQALTGADETGGEGRGGIFGAAGALFVAIDAGAFRPAGAAETAAATIADRIRAVPPAPGFEAVRIPGDPESESRARRLREGIVLAPGTEADLLETAASLGVAVSRAARGKP
ncbi:MAG: Ldh family oxidoreductase [Chloroflexota bacterium]